MNTEANELSKYLDTDDWRITDTFFNRIDLEWGRWFLNLLGKRNEPIRPPVKLIPRGY